METPTETPRETRIRLNKMERWCEKNAARLGPAAVRLRGLFEVAREPWHADYLEGEIRDLATQSDLVAEAQPATADA